MRRAWMGKRTVRQAARLAASSVQAERRRERVERDRRLEKLAVDVLTARGERDATIAATEKRAGQALQAMIEAERMSVTEAVQWCAGKITTCEATRLRRLATPGGDEGTSAGGTATPGCRDERAGIIFVGTTLSLGDASRRRMSVAMRKAPLVAR